MSMSKRQRNLLLKILRDCILDVFGDLGYDRKEETKEIIRKSVYLSEDDPGQWGGEIVINHEQGLPGTYESRMSEKWFTVQDEAEKRFNAETRLVNSFHLEPVNGAITAVYVDI